MHRRNHFFYCFFFHLKKTERNLFSRIFVGSWKKIPGAISVAVSEKEEEEEVEEEEDDGKKIPLRVFLVQFQVQL